MLQWDCDCVKSSCPILLRLVVHDRVICEKEKYIQEDLLIAHYVIFDLI